MKNIEYFVDCGNSSVPFFLWKIHSKEAGMSDKYKKAEVKPMWVQITEGKMTRLSNDTYLSFSFYIIDGIKIAFYYCDSMVVDHKLIEDYLNDNYFNKNTKLTKRDNHCNANNFHQCLGYIIKKNEEIKNEV